VFSAWSVKSGYKEVLDNTGQLDSREGYGRVQDASLQGYELGIELIWQLQNNSKKETRL
jgi:hypothetical protein